MTTYIFLIRMYPVKTKGAPKAGAGFPTNYQPKSGANHICYKNATQSRGNLVSVQIDILFGEKPAEKMDRGQHMSQRRGDFFILNENPTQCRGMADFVNPLPGEGGHPDPLTNTSHPPPLDLAPGGKDLSNPIYPVHSITCDELMLPSQLIQNSFGFCVKYSSTISLVFLLYVFEKYIFSLCTSVPRTKSAEDQIRLHRQSLFLGRTDTLMSREVTAFFNF